MKQYRLISIVTAAVMMLMGSSCNKGGYENHADSDEEASSAEEVVDLSPGHVNFAEALGLAGVKTIDAEFAADEGDWGMTYGVFTFNSDGTLKSYDESDTVEGAYCMTFNFGEDGLPKYAISSFADYWAETEETPVTKTKLKIIYSEDGEYTQVILEGKEGDGENVAPEEPIELSKFKKDEHGRIVEVQQKDRRIYNYTYEENSGVPRDANGRVRLPQVDMVQGVPLLLPSPDKLASHPETVRNNGWEFLFTYF